MSSRTEAGVAGHVAEKYAASDARQRVRAAGSGGRVRPEPAGDERRRRARAGYPRWLPFVAVVATGLVLGLAVAGLGPVPTLAAGVGLGLVVLAFTHAELVIVLVFAMASGLLPTALNPFFDLGVGSLQASDLLLFLLLGTVVVRVAVERDLTYRKTPLDVPLALFFAAVLLGLGVAVVGFGVDLANATYEVRMLAYYLLFFPVTNLVRTRGQLARLAGGLVGVALLLAVLMLVTSAFGAVPGYTESWALQEEGVARVFHPGFTVVYVGLMVVLAFSALGAGGASGRLAGSKAAGLVGWKGDVRGRSSRTAGSAPRGGEEMDRGREVRWLMIAVLALGVLSTLARNVVVSGALSLALLFAALRGRERSRLAAVLVLIALVSAGVVVGLLVAGEAGSLLRYADLYLERIGRMFSADIVSEGENLQPRWVEIQYAWERLQQHPVLGIGLYNPYRPAFYEGEPVQLRHFLHNAYLALWIKTGLPGLLAFLWMLVLFVVRAFRCWAHVPDRWLRAVVLGTGVAFAGLLISNFVAPTFVQPGSLAVFGLMLGINEAVYLLWRSGESGEWGSRESEVLI